MDFEKIFIRNDNGRITGYKRKGKLENGKLIFTENEKINEKQKHNTKNYNEKLMKENELFPCSHPDKQNVQELTDEEFIKSCEEKLTKESLFNRALNLRTKLRHMLEIYVDKDILHDFKTLVHILDYEKPNSENTQILNSLLNNYE